MSKEAMKLALEALIFNQANWQGKNKAVAALKQALEQPEPEPVACRDCNGMGFMDGSGEKCGRCNGHGYTSPPKREPLTEEEISRIWGSYFSRGIDLARAIEAAHGIEGEA
jgi:hypothetical protein